MGGSKAQTVGYKYFKGVMAVIGNRIEQLLDINPDNRGWIMTPEQKKLLKSGRTSLTIDQPNLFGGDKKEGGWVGALDIYVGEDNQPQNPYLAKQIGADVSAYPNRSYLVFHGLDTIITPENFEIEQRPSLTKGFQLVSMSGMMKEFMLWVKRTRIRNDGSVQWYERNVNNEIVCEIGERIKINQPINPLFSFICTGYGYLGSSEKTKVITNRDYDDFISGRSGYFWSGANYVQEEHWSGGYPTGFPYSTAKAKATFSLNSYGIVRVFGEIRVDAEGWSYATTGDLVSGGISGVTVNNDLGGSQFNIAYSFYFMVSPLSEFSIEFNGIGYKEEKINTRRLINVQPLDSFIAPPLANAFSDTNGIDINPIHKIREILTDDIAMGKPESDINDENFRAMADRIYDESLGISWCIQEKSCKEALDELGYHIEGGVRQNRQTGLYEVILFRDDLLELDGALHFDETNIKSFQPDIINAEDQINAVNVSFYDRENIKNSSFPLSDVGSFHTIDHENADELKFPYFMNRRNAELVGNWKLKQLSTMAWKGTFTTGRYEARKLNKYDVVLLSWKSKNIINLPVRVMNINLGNGRDNTVTLDFVEVVPYSNVSFASISVDPSSSPILPPQPNSSIIFEMPYFEAVQRMGQTVVDAELANNPEIGYLMAATIKPQNNSLNALLYTDGAQQSLDSLEEVSIVDYCASCVLDQEISFTDTAFVVKDAQDLSRVQTGTLVQLDQELLVYQWFDPVTKVLNVKRGALDTIPEPHLKDAVFYFWDDSSGLDQTVYVDGETVHAKVLTTTPSGVENLGASTVRILEIKGRAIRPYPPANVKINDAYWPTEIETDLVLTWVDRNRTQQTGGSILGWFDAGVTAESGIVYVVQVFDANDQLISTENLVAVNSCIVDYSSVTTERFKLKLFSKRDTYVSMQAFEIDILNTNYLSKPKNITAEYADLYRPEQLTAEFDNA